MNLVNDMRMSFYGRKNLFRLVAINVIVFLAFSLVKLICFLVSAQPMPYFHEWVGLHSDLNILGSRPWTVFTYMFVHFEFLHLLFNMLVLFWTGRIFCEFLPQKKLLSAYILGGLSGGIFFILMYNLLPVFNPMKDATVLIGASAGVLSVMAAAAVLAPDYPVHMILFGEVRLKYVAATLTLLYLYIS